jgi:4-diphosphocytidyl-2-C-methyl-D-erythritol kinase
MILFPKAKINLGLRIIGRRPDGFHDIETVFYPVGLSDALEFVVHSGKVNIDELVMTGLDIGTRPEKNLVIRAITKLRESFPLPFLKIHLHKAIPSGAGLGGGSSDAALILKAISKCFNVSIGEEMIRNYALELGSDCPFFIDPVPSLATGRGEILKPIKPVLEGYHFALVNPGIKISTREAYLNSHPSKPEISLEEIISTDPKGWKELLINDFEDFAFKISPQIAELKKSLYRSGALYSSMSGSGSTVYGIFNCKPNIPEKLKKYLIYESIF